MLVIYSIRDDGFRLQLHAARVETDNQPIYKHEAGIMAIVSIFAAWVTETDDEKGINCHVSHIKNAADESEPQKQ